MEFIDFFVEIYVQTIVMAVNYVLNNEINKIDMDLWMKMIVKFDASDSKIKVLWIRKLWIEIVQLNFKTLKSFKIL